MEGAERPGRRMEGAAEGVEGERAGPRTRGMEEGVGAGGSALGVEGGAGLPRPIWRGAGAGGQMWGPGMGEGAGGLLGRGPGEVGAGVPNCEEGVGVVLHPWRAEVGVLASAARF